VKAGIGRSFQITNIFPRLTVLENIMVAVLARSGAASRVLSDFHAFPAKKEEARALLETVGLADKADLSTRMLSHGDRRNLELGLTLALKPRLLLLDEPTAGMSPEETASTVDLIRRISGDTTILFTEHDMAIVFGIAHRVTVLQQGTVIADGTPAEIRANELVISAYLGTEPC
jgi:branched-chain amino acid transport system ATP-binding protein